MGSEMCIRDRRGVEQMRKDGSFSKITPLFSWAALTVSWGRVTSEEHVRSLHLFNRNTTLSIARLQDVVGIPMPSGAVFWKKVTSEEHVRSLHLFNRNRAPGKPRQDRWPGLYIESRCFAFHGDPILCLLYTSPSPRDLSTSRMPSSA